MHVSAGVQRLPRIHHWVVGVPPEVSEHLVSGYSLSAVPYNDFVSGNDSTPLHELFEFSDSVGGLKNYLLADGETYRVFGEAGAEQTVSIKEKLDQVYDAVFKNPYTDGRYERVVGKCSFSKKNRNMVLRISSAMSEYADYSL